MFSLFKTFTADGTRDILQKRLLSLLAKYAHDAARQGNVFAELALSHYKINRIEVLDKQTFLLETAPFVAMDLSTFKHVVPEYLMFRMPNPIAHNAVDVAALKDRFNSVFLSPSNENPEALEAAREMMLPFAGNVHVLYAISKYVPWINWLDRESLERAFGPLPPVR